MAKKSMKLGGGGRFQKIKKDVAKSYEKKGISPKRAEEIGAAVAAKQGIKKYGKKGMTKMAVKGRKRAARGRK
jgi:hypothetical protein